MRAAKLGCDRDKRGEDAAIDGCDRDAWQPKTAADGDAEGGGRKEGRDGDGGILGSHIRLLTETQRGRPMEPLS